MLPLSESHSDCVVQFARIGAEVVSTACTIMSRTCLPQSGTDAATNPVASPSPQTPARNGSSACVGGDFVLPRPVPREEHARVQACSDRRRGLTYDAHDEPRQKSMKLPIRKTRSYLLALLYKASFAPGMKKVLPRAKLELFLNLTWIFERLAYNASYAHYATWEHPGRQNTWRS